MAQSTKTFSEYMGTSSRDYCTARILSLTNELKALGHKPTIIAMSAVAAGAQVSREDQRNYGLFLETLGDLSRSCLALMEEDADEAGTTEPTTAAAISA